MGITLEELIVKLEADNSEFRQQMSQAQNATSKAMSSMAASVDEFTKKQKDIGFFERAMETMVGFIGGEAVIGAFEKLKEAAVEFATEAIKKSSEQIDVYNRLGQVLAQNGNYTQDAKKSWEEFASSLERTTKYQDEAIIKNASLLESLTGMKDKGLKEATKASLDLASGLGVDLESATRLVAKAFNGNVDALSRYGIYINKSSDDNKNFATTLELIKNRFGGLSEKEMGTFSGALNLLSKAFEDIQKTVGHFLTSNYAVVKVMQAVADVMFKSSDGMKSNEQSIQEMIANGLVKAVEWSQYLLIAMDALDKAMTLIWNSIETVVVTAVGGISGVLNALGVVSDETLQKIADFSLTVGSTSADEIAKGTTVFSDMSAKMAEIGVVAQEAAAKVADGWTAIPDVINNTNQAEQRYKDAQLQRAEEGKKLAEDLIVGEYQDSQARLEILQNRLTEEIQKINDAEATKKLTYDQAQAARLAAIDKQNEEERKRALAKQKFESDTQTAQIGAAGAVANALYTIGKNSSKELFLVTKAAAIAQMIIQTELAAAQALASPPGPPLTAPLAMGVRVAGYANAAAAAATAIQGLQGGMTEVPGIGTGDSYGPVALAPGERVVDSSANADLKKAVAMILSGQLGGSSSENIQIEVSFKGDAAELIEAKLIERQRLNFAAG